MVLPDDLDERLRRRIRPYRVKQVESGTAEELVSAWRASQQAPREEDEVWIVLLSLFRSRVTGFVPGLKEALRERHMTVMKTRLEIALQLSSRYFHLGRRLLARDTAALEGWFLLQECVEVLTWVAETEDRLPDHKRRQYRGQLANSLIILARKAPAEVVRNMLTKADTHARLAEELGDHTEEHYSYRIEAALRLFNVTREEEHLEHASRLSTVPSAGRTRRLRTVVADVIAERGYLRILRNETAEGLPLLHQARAAYDEALALVQEEGVDDGYLLAKRGLLLNRLYRYVVDPAGRRSSQLLDASLDDLLDHRAALHTNSALVANALLDRARIQARRGHPAAAREDREQARALLSAGSTHQTEGKLSAAELGQSVTEVIQSNDRSRLGELVEEISGLPADAAIPSAELAIACKLLVLFNDEESWRQPVARALDRIEADLAHPAVSPSGARHIAGHAALLAWQLARGTEDGDMHRRALDLYRTSFAATSQQPSVDALANAGTIALTLGKALLAGDEAQAEDAASLFVDAIGWFGTALSRASENPLYIRDDFDPKIVHSRLGETALRVYPLLWDKRHLDLAVAHLTASRDLGQDAFQLTGLLGDAYYRRGVRQNESADLEQAITLKDEAFAAGSLSRENRSVTAAAALRLFGLIDRPKLLTGAARRALEAAVCDPKWPWAVIQLAEIAGWSDLLDAGELASCPPQDLAQHVVHGQRNELLRRAAELAVHTTEFRMSVLGGQQRSGQRGVRILNDPHRLIEQAIVLKRVARDEAHAERKATDDLREWLASKSAPPSWQLPEPLDVVEVSDDSVYVMRRSQGRVLGSAVVGWRSGHGPDPRPRFREAVRFLAAFQAWRAESDPAFPRHCGLDERSAFDAQLDKACRKLDLDDGMRALLAEMCAPFLAEGMPVMAKKDPHPGNWLWTRNDELVLIDIEANVALPMLQEVVTIIDDLPLLGLSTEGWSERRALCDDYLDALHRFGYATIPDRESIWQSYESMLALHAVKGLGRLRRADPDVSSYTLGSRRMQGLHYQEILRYLRTSASRPVVRTLAEQCSAESMSWEA